VDAITLAVFIISMSITHAFLDFIPSIFLSAPNAETALSVMPGHDLLLKGNGYGAVRLTALGCFTGLIILIIITPLSVYFLPTIYGAINGSMALILIAASLFLIFGEKNKFVAFLIFMLSGILGIATLNLPIKEPLFPLLTGLFGTSMLITSISEKPIIPKQKKEILSISNKEKSKVIFSGIISSGLCSFLPGLGASQAAVIGSDLSGNISTKGFLMLLGVISTLVTGLNFVAIYAINKPRSGVAVVSAKILGAMTLNQLYLLLAAALISGSIALMLTLLLGKIFAKNIFRIDYSKVSILILIMLVLMCFFFSGILGLLVLITATSLGIVAIRANIRKMHLMGCIMLPVILWFL
jgi:putative membrane protein